jgi:hypothetical protein
VRADLVETVKSPSVSDIAHQRASEWFADPRISRPVGLYSTGEGQTLEAHSVERKLAAIFAADVEGYSRLMGRLSRVLEIEPGLTIARFKASLTHFPPERLALNVEGLRKAGLPEE